MKEDIVEKFEKDFREYLDNEINHYNVFGTVVSSEREIEWLKKYIGNIISEPIIYEQRPD